MTVVAPVGWNYDKWMCFVVCWGVNGDGRDCRAWAEGVRQVKFKDCQGADFLPGHVKTEPMSFNKDVRCMDTLGYGRIVSFLTQTWRP